MNRYLIFLITILELMSCGNSHQKMIRQAVEIAVGYASGQVNAGAAQSVENGVIIISDEQKRFVIDTAALFIGYIDGDEKEDAIISVTTFINDRLGPTEHLFIMNVNSKLIMMKSIESDMKILSLKDRTITAEVPEYGRNSPLFFCPSCREIVRFAFTNGELIRKDN